jgi:hypothetical protein
MQRVMVTELVRDALASRIFMLAEIKDTLITNEAPPQTDEAC